MKRFFSFFCLLFLIIQAYSFDSASVKYMKLENGLSILFLENAASPVVRTELCVNAGFSAQTPETAGFFSLYARLSGGEIDADCVRFCATVSPHSVEKQFSELSKKLRPPKFPEQTLNETYTAMKDEFRIFFSSPAGFINTVIDSRVFADAPWSRESAAARAPFMKKTPEEARAVLSEIAEQYYTPENAFLFVNGNITEQTALTLAKKYFSDAQNGTSGRNAAKQDSPATEQKKQRKFVLYHSQFSAEMTQIAVQYTNIPPEHADILAAVWNKNTSQFKKLLLRQRNLAILGAEYIDVASAQEKNSSRIIIQSLLGAARVSPVVQAELFLTMSRDEDVFSGKELSAAAADRKTEFLRLSESSDKTFEQLSRAMSLRKTAGSEAIESFFSKDDMLSSIDMAELRQETESERPFVFVLVHTSVYQKYAAEFKKAGYEAIGERSGVKNIPEPPAKKNVQSETELLTDISHSAERFIKQNRTEFSAATLKNGIPVTIKRSAASKTAVLSVTIAGGELLFTDAVPGLAAVLTNAIAANIQTQLDLFARNGAVAGFYEVSARTLSTHSIIAVTCRADEIDFVIQAVYSALVFCDITPASADRVTYNERTYWRRKTGSTEFQLLCEAVRILYSGTKYPELYRDTEEKPPFETMNFTQILENYPILLDASRFSLVLAGGLPDDAKLVSVLDKTFGLLETKEATRSLDLALPQPCFPADNPEKKITLRHLFLTDIRKDEAGPRPAVLVPTTTFLDPALICISAPDLHSSDCALFSAILIEISRRMEQLLSTQFPEMRIKAGLPENDIPFARITVTSVKTAASVKNAYAESIRSLRSDISALMERQSDDVTDLVKPDVLSELENGWLMAVIADAGSQSGAAALIQTGSIQKNPQLYLDQYEAVDKAGCEDYFLILESYFSRGRTVQIFSTDSN